MIKFTAVIRCDKSSVIFVLRSWTTAIDVRQQRGTGTRWIPSIEFALQSTFGQLPQPLLLSILLCNVVEPKSLWMVDGGVYRRELCYGPCTAFNVSLGIFGTQHRKAKIQVWARLWSTHNFGTASKKMFNFSPNSHHTFAAFRNFGFRVVGLK